MSKDREPRQKSILEGMHPHQPIVLQAIAQLTSPEDIRKFKGEFEGWLKTNSLDSFVTGNPRITSYQAIRHALDMVTDQAARDEITKRWQGALPELARQSGSIQDWEADVTFVTLKGLPRSPIDSDLFRIKSPASA